MAPSPQTPGIAAGRLGSAELAANFADLSPPLSEHEAHVAADRCYFCYDAPCVTACPTSIDIPMFIREIQSGVPEAAARTILSQNILGGMCARVCPTEELCEEACVRELAEGRPVEIGRLQRSATDALMARQGHPFARAEPTGKRVAVVGAGPAGLACAHRLAVLGHGVVLMDARPKGGGLNEFGIAAYKAVDGFAQRELEWLLGIGGITVEYGRALGRDVTLDDLVLAYDAVFLGLGLGGLVETGEGFELGADQVLVAIGQRLEGVPSDLAIAGGKIAVTGAGRTSRPKVWAGGDCADGGDDLTVTAVAEGRDAAMDIHAALTAEP